MDMAKFKKKHRLPNETLTDGLRPMQDADVPKVTYALNKHLSDNYAVHIQFSEAEVAHFLLPRDGVVYSWLVEDENTGEVTDFISHYALNSSILQHKEHDKIYAAYGYYNFVKNNSVERMKQLMKDNLIMAKKNNFDVFNITEVLKHGMIKDELQFKPGDGRLAHYFFNWRIKMIDQSEIGIVLV